MSKPLRKTEPLLRILNNSLISLPAPINLSIWWNFGSLLGFCIILQIITGIFLTIHFTPHTDYAFSSVAHISRDVNYGWALRGFHANGASLFFFCLYCHIGRGIYYGSYLLFHVWISGLVIFFLTIIIAFIGYVLPWGQIRYWAATVITNFLSAVPFLGKDLVIWVWGGFAVNNATLTRFFAFHFLFPFILLFIILLHLLYLHQTGSSDPLGVEWSHTFIPFHPYYTIKDLVGIIAACLILSFVVFLFPYVFLEPENFIKANPLSTPIHIKPEWYFLWAYTILRSVPNKLGGVLAILGAVLILALLPALHLHSRQTTAFYPLSQIFFWTFITNFLLLTWIGGKPVQAPFETLGQCFTVFYFSYFFISPLLYLAWDFIVNTPRNK